MLDKDFDKAVNDRLKNISKATPKGGWDSFSKKLAQEEGFEDIVFDQKVTDKLKRSRAAYNDKHWDLLSTRINKETQIKREVFKSKTIEFAAVFLLLITFYNFYPYIEQTEETPVFALESALPLLEQKKLKVRSTTEFSSMNDAIDIKIHDANKESFIEENSIKAHTLPKANTLINEIALLPINTYKIENSNRSNYNIHKPDQEVSFVSIPSLMLDIETDKSLVSIDNEHPNFYTNLTPNNPKSKHFSIYANSLFGIIRSPEDQDFTIDPYNIYNTDFGVTAEVSHEAKNFEAFAGLGYTKVSYEPIKITEISGGFNELIIKNTLDKIEFDLVHLPLGLRYFLPIPSKKMQFWAGLGTTINMAFYSTYNVETDILSQPSAVIPDEDIQAQSLRGERFENKNFHPGILEKGSLLDNMYLSLNSEIGASYDLNKSLSLAAKVGYNKAISALGLGPNEDVIDAMNLSIGVRANI